MAGKNVGITLLGVVVAIGAFVASNIWAQSLHEKVDRITNATNEWNAAYNAVNDKEIAGDVPCLFDLSVASGIPASRHVVRNGSVNSSAFIATDLSLTSGEPVIRE